MTRSTRRRAVGAICAVGVLAAAFLVLERRNGSDRFSGLVRSDEPATIDCAGSVVELEFDPHGAIDARVGAITVASADVRQRGLNHTACAPRFCTAS